MSYENPLEVRFSLLEHFEELTEILPAEILFESDVWIEDIIERVTSGTASLVHFLSHGTPGSKDDRLPSLSLSLSKYIYMRFQPRASADSIIFHLLFFLSLSFENRQIGKRTLPGA